MAKAKKDDTTVIQLKHPDTLMEKPPCPMCGSRSEEFAQTITKQVHNTIWLAHSDAEDKIKLTQASLYAVMGAKPQDELEAMLAAQMVAAHNATMECFRRAMIPDQSLDGRNMNLNQANKLSRSYATLMEALNRYRGKGQQKVTVEHVTVNAGGQAIVGNLTHEGGGVNTKTGEQPHDKQVTHAPVKTMSSPIPQGQPVPIPCHA